MRIDAASQHNGVHRDARALRVTLGATTLRVAGDAGVDT